MFNTSVYQWMECSFDGVSLYIVWHVIMSDQNGRHDLGFWSFLAYVCITIMYTTEEERGKRMRKRDRTGVKSCED